MQNQISSETTELREVSTRLLSEIEQKLSLELRQPSRALGIAEETARLGGKRARATIAALSGLAAGASRQAIVVFGSVCEIVHAATLIHDDVIDLSIERRGRAATHVVFGNKRAVLGGDALLVAGLRLLATISTGKETRAMLDCLSQMVEGEYLQIDYQFQLPPRFEAAMHVNRLKTSVLFGWCSSVAMYSVGASEEETQRAVEVGVSIGDAFQLIDDLLDLTGDEALTGKPVLQDIKDGKLTPPLIHLLHRRPELTAVLETYWRDLLRAENRPELLAPIKQAAIEEGLDPYIRNLAKKRLQEGLSHLVVFPVSRYADALRNLAEPLLQRVS